MNSPDMDLFALTETHFIRELIARQDENLHISYRKFILEVYDLCRREQEKGFAISALLLVEVEISALKEQTRMEKVNHALAAFITKSLQFIRSTLLHYKDGGFVPVGDDDTIERIGLNWMANKSALIEIGYAFKVANCFGTGVSAKEIIQKLAKIFRVDMAENYIYKKYNDIRTRSKEKRTYFIDDLSEKFNAHMEKADAED